MRRFALFSCLLLTWALVGRAAAQDTLPGSIVVTSDRDGSYQLYAIRPDGSDARRLTDAAVAVYLPIASPDGSRLAYLEQLADPNPDRLVRLMVANADGTAPVEIDRETVDRVIPNLYEHLNWSPDSRQVVYTVSTLGDEATFAAFVADVVTGETTRLPSPDERANAFYVAFAPDGTLLFSSAYGLYRMQADGSGPTLVSDSRGFVSALSPDGSRIAVVEGDDLIVVDAGSGEETVIIDTMTGPVPETSVLMASDLSWSPDGEWISGSVRLTQPPLVDGQPLPTSDPPLPVEALFTARADGSAYHVFTAFDYILVWSPDSTRIAYTVQDADGNAQVALANPDGTDEVVITSGSNHAQPTWLP